MSNIPPDIYARVHELALGMVNSTEAGDAALNEHHYESLLRYYRELTESGRAHPFLTEALADFTEDVATSVFYYRLALEQARMQPNEPLHTKMISLAERLIELGLREQAEAYLRDGRAEAVKVADADSIKNADRLLRDCAAS